MEVYYKDFLSYDGVVNSYEDEIRLTQLINVMGLELSTANISYISSEAIELTIAMK